jgi:hypothetical protein
VFTSVAETVALGIAAPLASLTSPERALLVPLCARSKRVLTMVNIHKRMKLYLHVRIVRILVSGYPEGCCLGRILEDDSLAI